MFDKMIEEKFNELKQEIEEETDRDIKDYNDLIVQLGNEIDDFNKEETPEKLTQINNTLDLIQEITRRDTFLFGSEPPPTEGDMKEVAEMLLDDNWE